MSESGRRHRYDARLAQEIETRWQRVWEERGTFRQPNPGEEGFVDRPRFYCLDMFPYPSGAGLHVGHPEGYTATDIISRYRRMRGFNVLHPMGWDAFGLPAEQYAIQTGIHPAQTTRRSIETFRRQLKRFGFCYDWSREIATIDPDYYRWTQWIFLQIYNAWYDPEQKRARPIHELEEEFREGRRRVQYNPDAAEYGGVGELPFGADAGDWNTLDEETRRSIIDSYRLAYVANQTVNWCPKLGTALANEEVIDGRSERGGHPVLRKPLRQWLFRITAYAERLLEGLEELDWPQSTKAMQAQWIGRSEGAEIDFPLVNGPTMFKPALRVFTTRPDTLFGATYMVVAPEHPLIEAILEEPPAQTDVPALRAYVEEARNRSDVERQEAREKTGVFTGVMAQNPATGEEIPIWTSDYVLMGYGHGAIMAVPAHDERDFEFARKFSLPIRDVVYPLPVLAMRFFAEHATEEDAGADIWLDRMCDFVALVSSKELEPSEFPRTLETVRSRRQATDEVTEPGDERPQTAQDHRGEAPRQWRDAIRAMGITSLRQLREVFDQGVFHLRAGEAYTGPGLLVNSSNDEVSIDGLGTDEARRRIVDWLQTQRLGMRKINYRLRDWLFSRQRYWGEPFPIVYDQRGWHYPVSEERLPVELPPLDDFAPEESDEPRPLLAKARDWLHTTAGEAGVEGLHPNTPVTREANTMPGWAGSCWYFLRFCDPKNRERFVGAEPERYWMGEAGVDLYIGGAEHAVLHLLYARFWHKVLYDLGHVSGDEPFRKLFHQGLITSFAYQRRDKSLVPVDEVAILERDEQNERIVRAMPAMGGEAVATLDIANLPHDIAEKIRQEGSASVHFGPGVSTGDLRIADAELVLRITAKMSKSLKNVINPDDIIDQYGADTFRLYEMYMGPLEQSKPWNTRDTQGLMRFCQRAWRMIIDEDSGQPQTGEKSDEQIEKRLHRMIAKVGDDIERLAFNTAIAAMIEFVNAATSAREKHGTLLTRDQALRFSQVLAPFAPHLGEELWHRLGGEGLVSDAPWPTYDEAMLVDDQIEIPVQVRGKVRARIMIPADADAKQMEQLALADAQVQRLIEDKTVRKVVCVPGRLVNIVVG